MYDVINHIGELVKECTDAQSEAMYYDKVILKDHIFVYSYEHHYIYFQNIKIPTLKPLFLLMITIFIINCLKPYL